MLCGFLNYLDTGCLESAISLDTDTPQCPRTDLNKRFLPRPKTHSMKAYTPIGLKSARIEIPHIGSHYIDFSKTDFYYYKNSFTVITFKLILLSKEVHTMGDFNSCLY